MRHLKGSSMKPKIGDIIRNCAAGDGNPNKYGIVTKITHKYVYCITLDGKGGLSESCYYTSDITKDKAWHVVMEHFDFKSCLEHYRDSETDEDKVRYRKVADEAWEAEFGGTRRRSVDK